ncbi:antigen 5 like allergen Cul n 1 [Zeugodacus cucurbitae]|uniref:antigen 5 like allergen Cul n 1 n=1 Tax=Zeugodacus cucurbitae TaxID=28588 RepID=UPI000596A638|nr:antigen 5 like allergen Cul n 1 [Zeugodacus cucurbitae]
MTTIQFVLLIITAVIGATLATDYCDPEFCGHTKHIACDNDGDFASDCRNPAMVELTKDIQKAIVNAHNKLRNRVARGTNVFKPACRMATMKWDDELAELAALNVKQCKMRHDECHDTKAYEYSGQNLAWRTIYELNATAVSLQMVNMWSSEMKHTQMKYIDSYPSRYNGPAIGHFTVMVADRNIRVGCAASTYDESGQSYKSFLFTCNYATTNMINFPIYKSCSVAASGCKAGKNPIFKNLCSTSEEYDVNKWF